MGLFVCSVTVNLNRSQIGYLLTADGENALLVDATDADRCECTFCHLLSRLCHTLVSSYWCDLGTPCLHM